MILYALVVSVCLSSGQCHDLSPELYEDLTKCVIESVYRSTQGNRSYHEEVLEEY